MPAWHFIQASETLERVMSDCICAVIVIMHKLWFPLTMHGIYMGYLVFYFPEELGTQFYDIIFAFASSFE